MENPTRSFREMNSVLQLMWKLWIKSKTVMSWSSRKKKEYIFILSEGNFFNICVLSHCIVYWINSQNIHTFPYQKTLLPTLLLLVLKIVESLRCFLKPLPPSALSICSLSIFEWRCRLLCNVIVFGVCRSSLSNSLCQLMVPAPYLRYNSPYV